MSNSEYVPPVDQPPEPSAWFAGVALIVAIIIFLAAFVYLLVRIDPYMADFISSDSPTVVVSTPSPAPNAPNASASPTAAP